MQTLIEIEPVLIEAADGSWLAVAPASSKVRVGVMESTAEQATVCFRQQVERLAAALSRD